MHYPFYEIFRLPTALIICFTQVIATGVFATADIPAADAVRAQASVLEAELASDPSDRQLRYDLATALNELAMLTDDGSHVDRALEILEALHGEEPEDATTLAMLGSTQTMKAQFAGLFSKMSWLRRGLKTIDSAHQMDGDNRDVRLIRAANAAHLPAWLDRDDVAERDFTWLLTDLENGDARSSTHAGAVYYFIGYFHMERGRTVQAREYFERAVELPQTPILAVKLEIAMDSADIKESSSRG